MPASTVAASTMAASAACTTAAARSVAGLCPIGWAPPHPHYPDPVRAMLIVNPHATSTTPLRRDVIARALASELDLTVVQTRYRGHAAQYAAVAAQPGGSANVFTRALGMPADPVDATGRLLAALTEGGRRTIGVGLAQDRYFTINAGLGIDAEVVRAIEGLRADGQEASAGLYVWTAIRHFYGVTNRRQPALALELSGRPAAGPLFFAIVSNAAPWTYLGRRPINPSP